MDILQKAKAVLEQPVCDHCLGRQFAQLLTGTTNKERGRMLRAAAAMDADSGEKHGMDMSNFSCISLRNSKAAKEKKCSVCGGFFENIDKWADKVVKSAKGTEFSTFLIGTKLSAGLVEKEEELWGRTGIEHCEPMKAEINREVGKAVEAALSKTSRAKAELKQPQMSFMLDISTGTVRRSINPVFIYGEYQKLKRGIPQTKWPDGRYKTSVEQIIAKPFMAATKGTGHKLHGMGREDIDARCLGWRPFVLEILEPKKRFVDMKRVSKKIGKQVRVREMRPSSIDEVRKIKEATPDKTYIAVVKCKEGFERKDIAALGKLKGKIKQKTPQRVLHRRADLKREREVKAISGKMKGKFMVIKVRGTSGLYIKELITGDNGRTKPSMSEVLGKDCVCKELDVVKIHVK